MTTPDPRRKFEPPFLIPRSVLAIRLAETIVAPALRRAAAGNRGPQSLPRRWGGSLLLRETRFVDEGGRELTLREYR